MFNSVKLSLKEAEEEQIQIGESKVGGIPDLPKEVPWPIWKGELECQLVTNGLYCGDETGYNNERRKALESDAVNWRILLQIDSNEEIGMYWGDLGRIYFWIREDDLRNKEFDNVWTILQCG